MLVRNLRTLRTLRTFRNLFNFCEPEKLEYPENLVKTVGGVSGKCVASGQYPVARKPKTLNLKPTRNGYPWQIFLLLRVL